MSTRNLYTLKYVFFKSSFGEFNPNTLDQSSGMVPQGLNFNSLNKNFESLKNFIGGMGESLDSGFASPAEKQIYNSGLSEPDGRFSVQQCSTN